MHKLTLHNLKQYANVNVNGEFSDECLLTMTEASLESLMSGKLKLSVSNFSGRKRISDFQGRIECITGILQVNLGDDHSRLQLSSGVRGAYDFRLWRDSNIFIGKSTSSNGVTIICDNSEFICGEDCMFSSGIIIQTADQHGIVDINTGIIYNEKRNTTILGDHVWLGRDCKLLPDINIGNGSVIGLGSIVTSDIPPMTISAGIPARIIKESRTWTRSPCYLDRYSQMYVDHVAKQKALRK